MNFIQSFRMAFKSIRGNKVRSVLTMLGIIIGVAAVIIMVSMVQGQNKKNLEYIESQGTNTLAVSAYQWNNNNVTEDLYDFCKSLGGLVLGVTPDVEVWGDFTVRYGAKSISLYNSDWEKQPHIKLGSDQYGVCNNYELEKGRELSYLDIEKCNNVCVIGGLIAEELFNYKNPVGEYININKQNFLVVGVYEKKNVEYWPELDNVIVLPYTFNRTLNNNQSMDQFRIKCASSQTVTESVTRLKMYLSGIIDTNYGYFNVQNMDAQRADISDMNKTQSYVLGGIAGISLLVGGIGIMNIMLVTVSERTREIGIRKAIGAERRSILLQFLVQASVICAIGGLLGILLGLLGTVVVGKLMLKMFLLPSVPMSIGAVAFSVILGIGFGMYPAIKASGLQPVEALRAE